VAQLPDYHPRQRILWIKFKVAFSSASDPTVGAVETLVKELLRIIKEMKSRVQPVEAPVVASLYRKLPAFRTLPQQAIGFRESPTYSRDQLRVKYCEFSAAAAAMVAKKQRAQRHERAVEQPTEASQVGGSLAGKHIDNFVRIEVPEVGEETGEEEFKYSKQWLPAVVTKVSDGTDTKLGGKGQKLKVKAG
jgi:hypothetical protein